MARNLAPLVADILVRDLGLKANLASVQRLRQVKDGDPFPYRTPHWLRIEIERGRKGPEVGLVANRDGEVILGLFGGTEMTASERQAFNKAAAAIRALQGDYATPAGTILLRRPGRRLSALALREA